MVHTAFQRIAKRSLERKQSFGAAVAPAVQRGKHSTFLQSRVFPMADDQSQRGPQDAKRINVKEDYEVRYWSESLGVSPERLKRAVEKAGVMAEDVRKELGQG